MYSNSSISPNPHLQRHRVPGWRERIRQFVEPPPGTSETESRRGRALAWILVTLFVLVAIALIITQMFGTSPGRIAIYTVLLSGLLVLLFFAFTLNRSGRYTTAAWITVTTAMFGTWGSIALDRAILFGDVVPMVYIALSIILCSLLLSVRVTAVLAAIQFLGLALVPIYYPETTSINWPSLLAFIFFTAVLGVVTNLLHRKDLEQIERQTLQLKESEANLRELSIRDPLTGLFNRRYMEETLERELSRAERLNAPLGVIMVDVDHFKIFNDTYGHAAGDVLLCELGSALHVHIRGGDILCRYGGEEFVLILPGASLNVMRARAETLRVHAKHVRITYDGQRLPPIAISLGVAIYPEHGVTQSALLRAADLALYQAKHQGRDRAIIFEEHADESVTPIEHTA